MHEGVVERYLRYLTTSVALCLALALSLAAAVLVGKRWKGPSIRSLWLFGLVPVLGFVGHTAAEPLASETAVGADLTALVPIVLLGFLVQIPFALVAVGFARHVLWLAERLARVEIVPSRTISPAHTPAYQRPRASRAQAFRLDFARTERGPPLLAA
jgi:hypothetical protein